jgi:hypothetical protein
LIYQIELPGHPFLKEVQQKALKPRNNALRQIAQNREFAEAHYSEVLTPSVVLLLEKGGLAILFDRA